MRLFDGIRNFLFDPVMRINYLAIYGFYRGLSDEKYLKKLFRAEMGKELNLSNPKTFNEKIQWLKINNRRAVYTTMVDKYEVKKYVSDRIGKEYVVPLLGVWDKFDDIDFSLLPKRFVLKCTHNSGALVICHDKEKLNMKEMSRMFGKCLKNNYYWRSREWPYKDVKPRIIAEAYIEDSKTAELRDYKFYCFNGECKVFYITSGRQKHDLRIDFYDRQLKHMDVRKGRPNADTPPEIPENFNKMLELAEAFSLGIPFLRVDFYETDGRIYFGEFTFSPWGGLKSFEPEKWDTIFGSWISLR